MSHEQRIPNGTTVRYRPKDGAEFEGVIRAQVEFHMGVLVDGREVRSSEMVYSIQVSWNVHTFYVCAPCKDVEEQNPTKVLGGLVKLRNPGEGSADSDLDATPAVFRNAPLGKNEDLNDPELRREYEGRFLEETLIFARTLVKWGDFIKRLEANNRLAQGSLLVEETPEQEVRSWLRAGNVPSRWKAAVHGIFQSVHQNLRYSIFWGALTPEEFFKWEQPD